MRAVLFVFCISAMTSFANADCLDDQREVNRLDEAALIHAKKLTIRDMMGNGCYVLGPSVKAARAKAAFIRRCYQELGLTRLQAEAQAHEQDMAVQQMGPNC